MLTVVVIVADLPEAGAQQVDHRQAAVDDLADRGLGADPAGRPLAHAEAVVDQQPVRDRLARRLQHLDGVEVGEPAAEARRDVRRGPATRPARRAAGRAAARSRSAPRTAAAGRGGRRPRRGRRRRDGAA